ncbi:MAG: hypothetical protein BRD41_06900 [Bacteroidetes bacterium QS_1_63_11]|nr:MAG: hypothetical protein BRD41_06900 [Bacteroidetes bacterium QS_1_63_11]
MIERGCRLCTDARALLRHKGSRRAQDEGNAVAPVPQGNFILVGKGLIVSSGGMLALLRWRDVSDGGMLVLLRPLPCTEAGGFLV